MRRWIAVLWHAWFFVIAGALYFFFVLPRWFELTGRWPTGLGLAMRIVCGALIGLSALPVVLTYLKSRRAEFGTPRLALTLRLSAIVLHVLAGAMIVGAAVSEIWVSLDAAGPTLFAIYGAAAALAVLGALSFYLAYAAELPPPPPKPLRPKGQTRRRGRGVADEAEADDDVESTDEVVEPTEPTVAAAPTEPTDEVVDEPATDAEVEDAPEKEPTADAETTAPSEDATPSDAETTVDEPAGNADEPTDDESDSKLRNRRPSGKSNSRLFGRSRRGVALED
ncbi:hypothetical protein CIW49_17545 [Mycolicibacterium sp. P1-18]|uniref:hypothetical protein n=1 Tax=Mycolicibacterium sp. P1-18 TaxID=2024615 RepID=UPI0011F16786|nr:hypothetical protein [Mycolicibacterium sp. P1-18]KAA0097651.1 hypothetical protein CIW49_17545 [Mycolicibacterium sp. P1-18]